MISPDAVTLRPAGRADVARVAALLVDLYDAELPGALVGPAAARAELLAYTLEADDAEGLQGRYVIEVDARVVGTIAMRVGKERPAPSAPRGTLRQGLRLFGVRDTARMVGTLAKAVFQGERKLAPDEVHFSGLVVEAQQRGRGLARGAVVAAERLAADRGCTLASLHVIRSNDAARRFWMRAGYSVLGAPPSNALGARGRLRALLPTFRVDALTKELA